MRARSLAAWSLRSAGSCCSRSWMLTVRSTPLIGRRGRDFAAARESRPRPGVDLAVRLLRRVAAGGVDEHRLVGEPPVAVARAADAAHAAAAHLLGEREREAGVEQRGRLARARRADEDVPGQLVEEGAAVEHRPLACRRRRLQHADGLREALVQRRQLAVRRARPLGHAVDEGGVAALAASRGRTRAAAPTAGTGRR